MTVSIVYRNHRGETATRRIIPQHIRFGACPWYEGEQWILEAYDLDRGANRSFAMADILGWAPDDGLLSWYRKHREQIG